jgi:CRISPR-associated protein Cas2
MSQFDPGNWLICYDIRNPKRLGRVFRLLKKRGIPIQYSVFLVEASDNAVRRLLDELAMLIDRRADDLRAYGLPTSPQYDCIGPSILPPNVLPDNPLS